jgi:hypothetical protein
MTDKVQQLRRQQESWMREREVAISRRDTTAQIEKENQVRTCRIRFRELIAEYGRAHDVVPFSHGVKGLAVTDSVLLDRVTERLTQRIEEKLRSVLALVLLSHASIPARDQEIHS